MFAHFPAGVILILLKKLTITLFLTLKFKVNIAAEMSAREIDSRKVENKVTLFSAIYRWHFKTLWELFKALVVRE